MGRCSLGGGSLPLGGGSGVVAHLLAGLPAGVGSVGGSVVAKGLAGAPSLCSPSSPALHSTPGYRSALVGGLPLVGMALPVVEALRCWFGPVERTVISTDRLELYLSL